MEFIKLCPRCLKIYTNGAIGDCGLCKIELIDIKFIRTDTQEKDNAGNIIYKFIYSVEEK